MSNDSSMRHLLGPRADKGKVCASPVQGACKQYDVRHMARAANRRAGTAAIGEVVDEGLMIKGVKGLRVVDMAAAGVSCGDADEWCGGVIATRAAEMVARDWRGRE